MKYFHLTPKEINFHLKSIYKLLGTYFIADLIIRTYLHSHYDLIINRVEPYARYYNAAVSLAAIVFLYLAEEAIVGFFYLLFAGQYKQLLIAIFVYFVVIYIHRTIINNFYENKKTTTTTTDNDFPDL
jgi:hypothetical protein